MKSVLVLMTFLASTLSQASGIADSKYGSEHQNLINLAISMQCKLSLDLMDTYQYESEVKASGPNQVNYKTTILVYDHSDDAYDMREFYVDVYSKKQGSAYIVDKVVSDDNRCY